MRDIKIQFLDKKFKILVREENQVDRVLWVNGTEAREIFKILDFMINTRPRSQDDRLSLEQERREKELADAEKAENP